MPTDIIALATTFDALSDQGNFQEASDMLAPDFLFSIPLTRMNKQQWIDRFPAMGKYKPEFEAFELDNGNSLCTKRNGIALLADRLQFSFVETWKFCEEGKIRSIVARPRPQPKADLGNDRSRSLREQERRESLRPLQSALMIYPVSKERERHQSDPPVVFAERGRAEHRSQAPEGKKRRQERD